MQSTYGGINLIAVFIKKKLIWIQAMNKKIIGIFLTIILIRISARENSIRYLEQMIDISRAFMSLFRRKREVAD